MFSKKFKARLTGFTVGHRKVKGQDEKRTISASLTYDFNEALAKAIGGKAVGLQEMLTGTNGDDSVTVGGSEMSLDTKEVRILFGEGEAKIEVDRTFFIGAKASAPLKNESEPRVGVTVKFDDDGDKGHDLVLWLRDNVGSVIPVRMDRRQLEIPQVEA